MEFKQPENLGIKHIQQVMIIPSDDELMMMVSNDGKFPGPLKTGAIRKQQSALIQLPAVTGSIQGIYLFFGSEKRKMYSGISILG